MGWPSQPALEVVVCTVLGRDGQAPCLNCPPSPTHIREATGPRTGFSRPSPGTAICHGADGAPGVGGGGQEASPYSSPTEQVFSGRVDTGISAPLSPEPQGPVSSRKNSPRGCARQLGSHGGGLLACRTRAAVDGSSHGLRGLLGPPVLPATGSHPSGSGLAASTRA